MTEKSFSKGLEGVIADETRVGLVDGAHGRLYYRGYAIEELGYTPRQRNVRYQLVDLAHEQRAIAANRQRQELPLVQMAS